MLLLEIELDQIRPLREYGGHWEMICGSFSIPFGSGLEVPSQYVSTFPFRRQTIYEEDKFFSSLMIVI